MASIFNQDIGFNYKGIITLGSTINQNLSSTLQYLTDGDGNNLPIQISTTGLQFNAIETIYRNAAGTNIAMNVWGNLGRVAIGGLATNYTPSATLQVRGDGTNPVFRAENNAGTALVSITNTGVIESNVGVISFAPTSSGIYFATNGIIQTTTSSGLFIRYGAHTSMPNGITLTSNSDLAITATSGTNRAVGIISTFAAAAGSALYRPLSITYTINNTGPQTGIATGIFLNATETALNSMTHNLMDLQVGAASRFRISNTGVTTINPTGGVFNSSLIGTDSLTTLNETFGATSRYVTISNTAGFGAYSVLTGLRARGTAASPTGANLNDAILGIISNAYDGTAGGGGTAGIFFIADANVTAGNAPQRITFQTSETSNLNRLERLKIMPNGQIRTLNALSVGFDGATSARLHVRGDGTNPIARFENSAGGASYIINAAGTAHTFTGSVDVSDVVNVAATRGFFWTNRGGIQTSGDGIILLRNNNNTDFNRLQFGGITASFPSLKRSTTALEARLADDSDFTFIQGKLRTETNFTSEPAVMASGYIVLYDLDGTAYKVLATAL